MSVPAAGSASRLELPCADGEFTPCVARAVRALRSAFGGDTDTDLGRRDATAHSTDAGPDA
ncbi:hypothetical protein GPX89_19080 [Nocardia sp. ET3-3]|uniref:Uncharacterized protein n=1 Tax=Nocardia terrae TaxID=2675851 RepID=A0A7K1UY85_9NOCA|nr:hypothetical protein [Nocardia terrae]MVU79336.1 hypothetical protein [Nocardia terrae]